MTCQEQYLAGLPAHRKEHVCLHAGQMHPPDMRTRPSGELSPLLCARAFRCISKACPEAMEGLMGSLGVGREISRWQREPGVTRSTNFSNITLTLSKESSWGTNLNILGFRSTGRFLAE